MHLFTVLLLQCFLLNITTCNTVQIGGCAFERKAITSLKKGGRLIFKGSSIFGGNYDTFATYEWFTEQYLVETNSWSPLGRNEGPYDGVMIITETTIIIVLTWCLGLPTNAGKTA